MYSIVLKSDVTRIFTINISNDKRPVPTSVIPVFRSKTHARNFSQEVLKQNNLYSTNWMISTCNFTEDITISTELNRNKEIMGYSCGYEEMDMSNIRLQNNIFDQYIGFFVIHLYYTNKFKCYLDGNILFPY